MWNITVEIIVYRNVEVVGGRVRAEAGRLGKNV